jgi:hypothetical protein
VVKLDPWLEPFSDALRRRYAKAQQWIKQINDIEGGVETFSRVSHLWKFVKIQWLTRDEGHRKVWVQRGQPK